jgi:hypothetical protein
MLQIIIEGVAYVVQAEAPTVIYNMPRIPRPVGYWLHELFMFLKAETRTDLQSDHSFSPLKKPPKLFVADGLSRVSQLNQHTLRLIIPNWAILRVVSPPPTLPVVDFRPVGKL